MPFILADAPPWFQWAMHEIGQHEIPPNRGPVVQRYIDLAHCGRVGDPWCAIFANAALESSGIRGTRSPSSQSFRHDPNFVELDGPALGAVTVFWRGSPNSGLGHAAFYRGELDARIWALGGNEGDMVQLEALPKHSAGVGLVGYYWPKMVAPPSIGAVMMPPDSPSSVQTADDRLTVARPHTHIVQADIIATMFSGPSAYGGMVDPDRPGVALPYRFSGHRPRVRVTNVHGGRHVDCEIVDIGPWNVHDPYWETGRRPQAETGRDMIGRRTNGAGIDLTLAAADAIGIDGKGTVSWQFV